MFAKAFKTVWDKIIWAYRFGGMIALLSLLLALVGYAFAFVFFLTDKTWMVPVIISTSDTVSLDLTQKIVLTQQTREDLALDIIKLQNGVIEMRQHQAALQKLEPALSVAIDRERRHNTTNGDALEELDQQKRIDNFNSGGVLADVATVESSIDKDLASGLITKTEAASARASLNTAYTAFTDSRIGEVLLRYNVLAKKTTDTKTLDTLSKAAELHSEISQLNIAILVAERQIKVERDQVARLDTALDAANTTAYASVQSNATVAFVPYDHTKHTGSGTVVYACEFYFLWCHNAGTVDSVYSTEQHQTSPFFRVDTRGVLAKLNLKDSEDSKNDVLFLRRKPLGF